MMKNATEFLHCIDPHFGIARFMYFWYVREKWDIVNVVIVN